MLNLVEWIDRRFYAKFPQNWDDELFRDTILQLIDPSWEALDLGAGAGLLPQMNFRGIVRKVSGVDLDPRVLSNHALDEASLGVGEAIPYPDEAFDLIFADNVLEHLPDPAAVFREIWRTLRPGGVFLFKTPNRRHYVPTLARLTPHAVHQFVNRLRGRAADDTFPTHYRANTSAAIRRLARDADLIVQELRLIEGRPEYLRMSALTYLPGMAYERVVNSIPWLAPFRVVMIGQLSKLVGRNARREPGPSEGMPTVDRARDLLKVPARIE
jgi:SAM-dependent methyltransferase